MKLKHYKKLDINYSTNWIKENWLLWREGYWCNTWELRCVNVSWSKRVQPVPISIAWTGLTDVVGSISGFELRSGNPPTTLPLVRGFTTTPVQRGEGRRQGMKDRWGRREGGGGATNSPVAPPHSLSLFLSALHGRHELKRSLYLSILHSHR